MQGLRHYKAAAIGPKKLAEIVVPIVVTAVTMPIEIKPAMRLYSMAVMPDLSPANRMNEVVIRKAPGGSPAAGVWRGGGGLVSRTISVKARLRRR